MYKGEVLPNNSIIVHDFGYGSNVSIYCVTDLRPCCTDPGQGEWYDEWYQEYILYTLLYTLGGMMNGTSPLSIGARYPLKG